MNQGPIYTQTFIYSYPMPSTLSLSLSLNKKKKRNIKNWQGESGFRYVLYQSNEYEEEFKIGICIPSSKENA